MMNKERIKHTFTGFHNRKGYNSKIAICSCGWKDKGFRKLNRMIFRRRMMFCIWRGCKFGGYFESTFGPADAQDEEFDVLYISKQCERCYRIVEF